MRLIAVTRRLGEEKGVVIGPYVDFLLVVWANGSITAEDHSDLVFHHFLGDERTADIWLGVEG